MNRKKLYFITQAAMIAAIYVVLTVFINTFNLASGTIQIRISEALTVLPFHTGGSAWAVYRMSAQ